MDNLESLTSSALQAIELAGNAAELDGLRVQYLGKKGSLTEQLKALGKLPAEDRPAAGVAINQCKQQVQEAINLRKESIDTAATSELLQREAIDVSLPGRRQQAGALHPVTRTIERIEDIFSAAGFDTVEGPEIEDDYHNFEALNIPDHHPARAMHDTFYFDTNTLLRTPHLDCSSKNHGNW